MTNEPKFILANEPKFILCNRRDGPPRMDEDGKTIVSDGVIGRVTAGNAYLAIYAEYANDDPRRPCDLAVGECIPQVRYRLSGEVGRYDIYRVS